MWLAWYRWKARVKARWRKDPHRETYRQMQRELRVLIREVERL